MWFYILLTVIAVWVFIVLYLQHNYRSSRKAEQIIFAKTSDGAPIALHRYLPKTKDKRNYPVILCHGMGANRFNFDFDDRYSVAAYLSQLGFDCFVLELRGSGWSQVPDECPGGRWNTCFEDHVRKDIPAAVEKVLAVTGAKKLHWVGHSMGGIVLYCYAIEQQGKNLKSAVTIGSPVNFTYMSHMKGIARLGRKILPFFKQFHARFFMNLSLPFVGRNDKLFGKKIYLAENCDLDVIRYAAVNLVTDSSSQLMLQFADWVLDSDVKSADGIDWQNQLGSVKQPIFAIAGSLDYFAKPDGIKWIYEHLGSKDKKLRIFGKAYGDAADYGHGDLVVGRTAPTEVFPAISEWLISHDKN